MTTYEIEEEQLAQSLLCLHLSSNIPQDIAIDLILERVKNITRERIQEILDVMITEKFCDGNKDS